MSHAGHPLFRHPITETVLAIATIASGIFAGCVFSGIGDIHEALESISPECEAGQTLRSSDTCRVSGIDWTVVVDENGFVSILGTDQSNISDTDIKIDDPGRRHTIQLEDLGDRAWYVHAAGPWQPFGDHGQCHPGLTIPPGGFCIHEGLTLYIWGVDQLNRGESRDLEPLGYALFESGNNAGEPQPFGTDDGKSLIFGQLTATPSSDGSRSWKLSDSQQLASQTRNSPQRSEGEPGLSGNTKVEVNETNWINRGHCGINMVLSPGELCIWGTQPFMVFENVAGVDRLYKNRFFWYDTEKVEISEGETIKFRAKRDEETWVVEHSDPTKD